MAKGICIVCGKEFTYYPSKKTGKFCSRECYHKYFRGKNHPWYKGKAKLTCPQCGKQFSIYPAWARKGVKFCSKECRIKWMKEYFKGKNNPNWEGKANNMKTRLADPQFRREWIRKMCEGRNNKPTDPERKVIDVIKKFNLPFKYVGDGKILIGYLNPDFIHNNGERKIIEVFGRAFHDPSFSFRKRIPWYQQYWGRIAYYAQYGYTCLILWDDEVDNADLVLNKIANFLEG